jgi:cytochrome P450/NADPH-cytochrome P450 reductase
LSIGLSRSEILDEMISFLTAGFETTSTALSWFIFAMSKYPRVQQKIKAELKGENERYDLSVDRLDSLVYLDCVIKEIFRYYSPISGTTRTLTADDRLPESGFQLYKGEEVVIPSCVVAKDPQLWSIDPELFYPERFLNEDKNHHPYAFLPFGGGHRSCIGQDLARFELKVIGARMLQYVTFGDGGPVLNAGGCINGIATKPKKIGITIKFDRDEQMNYSD